MPAYYDNNEIYKDKKTYLNLLFKRLDDLVKMRSIYLHKYPYALLDNYKPANTWSIETIRFVLPKLVDLSCDINQPIRLELSREGDLHLLIGKPLDAILGIISLKSLYINMNEQEELSEEQYYQELFEEPKDNIDIIYKRYKSIVKNKMNLKINN